MANTIGFGQAAVNNTNGFGKAPTNNTIDFGEVCANSWSPETNLTGTGATPSYQNEYSFQFDGVDDYIQTNSTYSELDGQNKMTLSLWMKPISGAPLYEYVVTVPRNSTANEHVFSFQHFENNYLSFSIDGRTTKGVQGNISGINYGQWNHVLCCLDGTLSGNDRMRIYINGVDESYQFNIGTFTYLQNASGELMIGEEPQGAYNPYKGLLDEVAIWSGTDLRDDISTIYNSGVPNDLNNNGLTAPTTWYRMGEAATFDGIRDWNLVDQGTGGNDAVSQNIAETERVTDVPT